MKSPDREVFLNFPEYPAMNLEMVFVSSVQSNIFFDGTLASIKSHSIGRIHEARVSSEFDAARERGEIDVESRNAPDLLVKAIAFKRLDLVAIPKLVALWSAKKLQLRDKLVVLHPSLNSTPVYIAFSKRNVPESLAHRVSAIFKKYDQDGTHKKVISRYLKD